MEFNKSCKIEKAASKDQTRQNLHHPILTKSAAGEDVLVACDGHILAVVPVLAFHDDTSGPISGDALALARKNAKKTDAASVRANGSLVLADGATLPRPEQEGYYPNWEQILESSKSQEPTVTLGLNAKLMADLAEALGSNKGVIKLEITDANSAIRVSTDKGYGLIMPARI
jgi:hypothetical protein